MRKIISVLMAVLLAVSVFSSAVSAGNTNDKTFRFNNGKFRILMFADTQDDFILDKATAIYLEDSVKVTKPDLVVIAGDCISGGSCPTKFLGKMAISGFMKIFEKLEVPVAIVFGNHDSEGGLTKEEMIAFYETFDCFAGCAGEEMTGCGNYNIPILASQSDKTAFNLWFTDSLTYNGGDGKDTYPEDPDNGLGGYGCVHKDQIEWYVKKSNELKAANEGNPVPSLAFQHIVVPEIYGLLEECEEGTEGSIERDGKYYKLPEGTKGKLGESPCPPNYTNGQIDAMVEQGDVLAMFTGHDHKNTMEIKYKNIDLVSTPGAGFNSYGDYDRGSRVIDITEDGSYTSRLLRWREFYDADNNQQANDLFTISGNEFSTSEKIPAFFRYFLGLLTGKKINPVITEF